MEQQILLGLYKKIAKEYGISKYIVEHIVRHQFNFVKKSLESSELPAILLHRLGTFRVKDGRLDFIIRNLISKIKTNKIDREEGIKEVTNLLKIRHERRKK